MIGSYAENHHGHPRTPRLRHHGLRGRDHGTRPSVRTPTPHDTSRSRPVRRVAGGRHDGGNDELSGERKFPSEWVWHIPAKLFLRCHPNVQWRWQHSSISHRDRASVREFWRGDPSGTSARLAEHSELGLCRQLHYLGKPHGLLVRRVVCERCNRANSELPRSQRSDCLWSKWWRRTRATILQR